jgi:predicted O-methyltransferase YrrM
MQTIIISPPHETSWSMPPSEFHLLLTERWPEGEVEELKDSTHALSFDLAGTDGRVSGRLALDGRSVAIEQATDYEPVAEFAVWFRSHVPPEQPLIVWDEAFNWSAELSPDTTAADVLAAIGCSVRVMDILEPRIREYIHGLRPERGEVMREMEALADRRSIPIVHWEAGRLLATLCRALDPVVLEVGTAIGYSTLHMAEQLENGRVVTLERDPERASAARAFWERAGVADRIELIEGDATKTLAALDGPFDLLFVDATKDEYRRYIELAEPKLSDRAVLVVDNMLMSGEVALPVAADTNWRPESLDAARALNAELLSSDRWVGSLLPVGDGVALATRR